MFSRAKRKKDREDAKRAQRDIATAALAGWRFVPSPSITLPAHTVWDTYAPDGSYHGMNGVLHHAALYALAVMKSNDDSKDGRQGQRMIHDPAADQDKLVQQYTRPMSVR